MPDYRINIDLKNVAEGDAIVLARDIWDINADSFDAAQGDFDLSISRVEPSGAQFDIGWAPEQ